MKKFLSITITTLGLLVALPVAIASAQTTQPAQGSGQALEIGPPVISVSGDPGETIKAQISLRDVSANKLIVTNEINDFVAGGEDGTPKLLLNTKETSPYSIKSWISPLPKFTLVPRQVQTLNISIKIPANAAPGGYYGVIRFTGTPPELEGTGVSLSASLGSLILLKVNGNAKEEMNLVEFTTVIPQEKQNPDGTRFITAGSKNWLFESPSIMFLERVKNTGNIHQQPIGTITITDMFGKVVGEVKVNSEPSRNVLPGSIRKFEQPLNDALKGKMLFGKYTAKLELAYGSEVRILTKSVDFWIIPYTLLAIIIVSLIVIFFAIRFALRSYAKRVINQTGRRRR